MGYVKRNKISGDYDHQDIELGKSYGPKELQKRAEARQAELEAAIARDSSKQGVSGDTLSHPATDIAKDRLNAQYDRENALTNADDTDKPEQSPRKAKRNGN